MCTLSWIETTSGYQLFFNRDEQRTRQQAMPPEVKSLDTVNVLSPIDPAGGGSWISVNEYGLSLCLLNYYQGATPPGLLVSRGALLLSVAHHSSIDDLNKALLARSLTQYAPFTLIVFGKKTSTSSYSREGYQWNGESLNHFNPSSPITSSSVMMNEVKKSRFNQYFQQVKSQNPSELKRFHLGHDGGKNHRSVCMHREDAKTVSFSHISVENGNAIFSYQNGAPCERQRIVTSTIPLKRDSTYSSKLNFFEIDSAVCGP